MEYDLSTLPDQPEQKEVTFDLKALPDQPDRTAQGLVDSAVSGSTLRDDMISTAATELDWRSSGYRPGVPVATEQDLGDFSLVQSKPLTTPNTQDIYMGPTDRAYSVLSEGRTDPAKIPMIVDMSRRTGLPPSIVETHFKELTNLADQPDLTQPMKSFSSGAYGTAGSMAGAVGWITGSRVALDFAKQMNDYARDLQAINPSFFDLSAAGLGSMGMFFLPGMGVAAGTSALAHVVPEVANWLGVATSTALESVTEAGDTYMQMLSEGKAEPEASKAATETFWLNIPLIAITNKLGVFGDNATGFIKKALTSAPMEGAQEFGQDVIQSFSQGKPINLESAALSGAVGAVTGGIVGGATGAMAAKGEQKIQAATETVAAKTGIPVADVTDLASRGFDVVTAAESLKTLPDVVTVESQQAAQTEAAPKGEPKATPAVQRLSPALYQAEATAVDFFKKAGWSHEQAVGIVANLSYESSGMQPNIREAGGKGFGLAQWTSKNRVKELFEYAASKGEKVPTFQTQLEFVDRELRTTEKAAGDALAQTQTIEDATRAVSDLYERPGKPRMEQRLAAAKRIAEGKGVYSREKFETDLAKNQNVTGEQRMQVMSLADAVANAWAESEGRTADEWYGTFIQGVKVGGKDVGGLAQYAGSNALGWDEATGKFSSLYDKKERFEIDDSKAVFNPEIAKNNLTAASAIEGFKDGFGRDATLGDILVHDELYRNYPEARDIRLVPGKSGSTDSSYNRNTNTIMVGTSFKSEGEIKGSILHEIQHAIQRKEGFARGGTPEGMKSIIDKIDSDKFDKADTEYYSFKDKLPEVYEANKAMDLLRLGFMDQYGIELWDTSGNLRPDADRELFKIISDDDKAKVLNAQEKYNKAVDEAGGFTDPVVKKFVQAALGRYEAMTGKGRLTPMEAYQLLVGEIEARDAAARASLTPEKRFKTTPYSSENIALEDAITLYQRGPAKKGAVQFAEDGRAIIHLFQKADVSTIIHELGHILRRQLSTQDLSVIEQWVGSEQGKEFTDEQEEKFARGFERYVMEGKAPSTRLRSVFYKLRDWLFSIYRSVKKLDVELTDEVRGVFDRLVSTDAERKANLVAQMNEEYAFIEPAEVPLTAEQLTNYDAVMAEASRRALVKVEAEVKARREKMEREWRKEAEAQVAEDPVHQAKEFIAKRGGINAKSFLEDYDLDTAKELNRKQRGLVSKKGKLQLDETAMDMGFENGDAMVEAFLSAQTKGEAIESYVDSLRQENREDAEYDEADMQLRLINAEIEILAELTEGTTRKSANKTARGIKHVIRKRTEVRVGDVRMVSEYKALKAAMRAASIAAREAFATGRREEALTQKLRQQEKAQELRERLREKKEFKDIQASLQKMLDDKKIDWEYKQHLIDLLSPFNVKRITKQGQGNYGALRQWLDQLEAAGEAVFIDRDLLDRIEGKVLNDLTMDELHELHEAAKQIHHLGKAKAEFMGEMRKINFTASKIRIIRSLYENARKVTPVPGEYTPPSARVKTGVGAFMDALDRQHMNLIQPQFLLRWMDGFHDMGPVYEEMWLEVKHAEDEKLRLGKQIEGKIKDIFGPHEKQLASWSKVKRTVPGLSWKPTTQELMMIYANSLHPDNRAALMSEKGNNMTEQQITDSVNMLTPEERGVVDRIVNELLPILRPKLQQAALELTGLPLKMVEGTYFPIIFDRDLTQWLNERKTAKEAENAFKDYFPSTSVSTGSVKQRTGGKMPILLHFSGLMERLYSDLQYSTHAVAVRNLLKLINDPDVRRAVIETKSENVYNQLKPWLKEVANPGRMPLLPFEGLVGAIRRNTVLHIMAFRLSTALQQPSAFMHTIDEIGPGWAIKGINEYLSNASDMRQFIYQRSPSLANRARSFDREMQDLAGSVFSMKEMGKGPIRQAFGDAKRWVADNGMWLTAYVDSVTAEMTWLGAYSKAMSGEIERISEGDEERAIDYADGVVGRTQGSGNPKDLAAVARGNEFTKTFMTFFYTFFNTMGNKTWEMFQKYRTPTLDYNLPDLIKSLMLITVIPALINELFNKRSKVTMKDLALAPAKYMGSGIPLVRDAISGLVDGYDYRGGLMGNIMEQGKRLGQSFGRKKDKERAIAVNALKMSGYATGLPPDQFIIVMEAALNATSGKGSPWDLIWRARKGK